MSAGKADQFESIDVEAVLRKRVKELTAALAERDRRIAELEAEVAQRKAHELAALEQMAKARRAAQEAQSNRDTLTMLGMFQVDEFTSGSLVKRLYDRCRELEGQLKSIRDELAWATATKLLPQRPRDGDKEGT